MKPIKDTFIRGIISGITGGVLKDIPALILKFIFKNPRPTFWDYMSLLAIGRLPRTWVEYLFAVTIEVLWATLLAIVFVYLRPDLKSKHYILQGAGYGMMIWLLIRAAAYFFKATELIYSQPLTAFTNLSISIFYGILIAIVDHRLEFPKNPPPSSCRR